MRAGISNAWGRFPLRLAFYGLLAILAGYSMQTGVWAGLFPIWGAALVVIGLLGFLTTWYTYQ